MFLDNETFTTIISNTPLVSIDLIVINERKQALLGERLNRPAKGNWFVPGGRIFKNESLESAFKRLSHEELAFECKINDALLLGPYDHFYNDSVVDVRIKTHYVAIAYILRVDSGKLSNLPMNAQHSRYKWFDMGEIKRDPKVHNHTKRYFEAIVAREILSSCYS